jgi:pseudaminic acid cytidylyltransferase
MKDTVLAVIPARGGSKRIPHKNIRILCGKPIIEYTIEAALQSKIFSSVIVSTDSQEIADISQDCGADVPFLRLKNLSDDYTPVSLVTLDAVEKMQQDGRKFRYIAQLLPNCPLRDSADIIHSFTQFMESKAESQISVTRYGWLNPWWAMTRNENKVLSPVFLEQTKKRSQDLPDLFCPTGAIWWIHLETLLREKTFHCENRTGWEIPWDHAVDIDTDEDWRMADALMKQRMGLH